MVTGSVGLGVGVLHQMVRSVDRKVRQVGCVFFFLFRKISVFIALIAVKVEFPRSPVLSGTPLEPESSKWRDAEDTETREPFFLSVAVGHQH
jgi:hypothetical protein